MTDKENDMLIDLTFLREFCKDNKEKMAHYIHLFLESAPEQVESMKSDADAGNWQAVRTTAHSLKPQLTFIGVGYMQPLVEKIESASVSANMTSETITLLGMLEDHMEVAFNQLIQTLVSLS
jgi:HPt (histidine-containing phosphotransfer) domain-containing protein